MHVNAELALLKSTRPDINELEDIVGDILQDDRRATEVRAQPSQEGAFWRQRAVSDHASS